MPRKNEWVFVVSPEDDLIKPKQEAKDIAYIKFNITILPRTQIPTGKMVINVPGLDEMVSHENFEKTFHGFVGGFFDKKHNLYAIEAYFPFGFGNKFADTFLSKGIAAKIESRIQDYLRKKFPGIKVRHTGGVSIFRWAQLEKLDIHPYAPTSAQEYAEKLIKYRKRKRMQLRRK